MISIPGASLSAGRAVSLLGAQTPVGSHLSRCSRWSLRAFHCNQQGGQSQGSSPSSDPVRLIRWTVILQTWQKTIIFAAMTLKKMSENGQNHECGAVCLSLGWLGNYLKTKKGFGMISFQPPFCRQTEAKRHFRFRSL
ncbi:hypothetical protein P4T04_12420 [Bacillus badius]|uniref:hypothetical protein n=1 Tax=Bacillus badius TaxID=1455 RepID=UPI002E231F03|nr:hypothetical protein [Bacillus badius]